jgi:hypothetical protein
LIESHPLATPHLPPFIAGPGETDVFLAFAAVTLVASVLAVGVIFFWLHSLPERLAHKHHKFQIELIAFLGLLSLFTHVHAFWVAALVLALVKIPEFALPDVLHPLRRMADSMEKLAEIGVGTRVPVPTELQPAKDGPIHVQPTPAPVTEHVSGEASALPSPDRKA